MPKLKIIVSVFAVLTALSYAGDAYPPAVPLRASFRLDMADKPASTTIKFPAVKPKPGYGVVLRMNARLAIENAEFGGWNPYLALNLNGTQLERNTRTGSPRLLRRGTVMESTIEGKKDWWGYFNGKPTVLLYFVSANTEKVDPRVISPRDEGYAYWFDVTDAVNFIEIGPDDRIENAVENTLEVGLQLTTRIIPGSTAKLAIRDLEVIEVPLEDIRKMSGFSVTAYPKGAPAASLRCGDCELTVNSTGGMVLAIGGESWHCESFYSYESRPEMKFNALGIAQALGDGAWRPAVNRIDARTIEVTARSRSLRLKRRIEAASDRFRITDTLTNVANRETGIRWRHTLGAPDIPAGGYRFAGQSGQTSVESQFATYNPTVFARHKQSSVGIVLEDTVSRTHLQMTAACNVLSFGAPGVGLAAGDELTQEWVIYPSTGNDYFDFVNLVRADWGVNFTIPGPMMLRGNPALARYGIRPQLAGVAPWLDYAEGAGLGKDEFAALVRPKVEALRKAYPGIRLLGMLETNLIPFDVRSVEWGGELPVRRGERHDKGVKYDLPLSQELSRKLLAASPYRDCMIRTQDGRVRIDNFYPKYPFIDLMVQPEKGNTRYRTFIEQTDFLMDDLGLDGIYVDQFRAAGEGGLTDERWDGRTVVLDKTGAIVRKRYSYAITAAASRAELVRRVVGRGGIVVTNGQAQSKEERDSGALAFAEMENDQVDPIPFLTGKPPEFKWQSVSHLGTPIALGIRPVRYENAGVHPNRWAELMNKGVITALRNGLVFYLYQTEMGPGGEAPEGSYEMFNRMFPFTPVELHEGWVAGRERTITAVSGNYRLNGDAKPEIWHFNRRALPYSEAGFKLTGKPGNWNIEVKLDDWNEIAILIAKDE